MTFKEIQDEVISLRFNDNLRTKIKTWINVGYQRVWSSREDWDFRRVGGDDMPTFATTAGDPTPDISSLNVERPIHVFDDQGGELLYVTEQEWERLYAPDIAVGGTSRSRPDRFAWANRDLLLYPIPDKAYTFRMSHWRRFSHLNTGGGAITAGFMVEDGDVPIWDPEHHYLLVWEAIVQGVVGLAAADAPDAIAERDALYGAMVLTHAPDSVQKPMQYGVR